MENIGMQIFVKCNFINYESVGREITSTHVANFFLKFSSPSCVLSHISCRWVEKHDLVWNYYSWNVLIPSKTTQLINL